MNSNLKLDSMAFGTFQVLLTFVFFLPGIFMILSCTCVGINPSDLPIGVLNQV